ncbi:MAG: hypothetical protein GX667_01295 [Xanthomonadaceae bacterium]|nr:hypothetical protein [Xanthomonadaceae bacterium]
MTLTIAVTQLKTVPGHIEYNKKRILAAITQAKQSNADIILFPELTISGYGASDYLLKPKFIDDAREALYEIAHHSTDIVAIVGFPERDHHSLYSSAAIVKNGQILGIHRKGTLSSTELVMENYYISPGDKPTTFTIKGKTIGIAISEDFLDPNRLPKCDALLLMSAFHWSNRRHLTNRNAFQTTAKTIQTPIIISNALTSCDQFIFSGYAMVINDRGEQVGGGKRFNEGHVLFDIGTINKLPPLEVQEHLDATLYRALMFGLQEMLNYVPEDKVTLYIGKCLESHLLLTLAVDALGADKVYPVHFTTADDLPSDLKNIRTLCKRLNVRLYEYDINKDHLRNALMSKRKDASIDPPINWAEESVDRYKKGLLLAFSDLHNAIVLGPINKTQIKLKLKGHGMTAAGHYMPFIDLYRTDILRLADYRDLEGKLLNKEVMAGAKSEIFRHPNVCDGAELSFKEVDQILFRYLDRRETEEYIAQFDHDLELVTRIAKQIDLNNLYNRYRLPGPYFTTKALSKSWHDLHRKYTGALADPIE